MTTSSFRIGQHVRLIGTSCTGRVVGLVAGGRLIVREDGTGDYMVYPVDQWEVVE